MTIKPNTTVIVTSVIIAACIPLYYYLYAEKNINYKIFQTEGGWGYDIIVKKKIFIHQESVPSFTGEKAFVTKEQAEKVAELIINKIKRKQPPAVTTFELRQILPACN
jgi:hypothetical protein